MPPTSPEKGDGCAAFRGVLLLLAGLATAAAFAAEPAAELAGEVRIEKDVAYLDGDRAEKADLYLPAASEPGASRPAVVIIHGGGWTGGDKAAPRERNIGSTLAAHGYVGMSINYQLAKPGRPTFPGNVQDVKRAVRWLRKNADRLQLDAGSIGAIGGSAGGHLTALLAVSGPECGLDPGEDAEISCRIQAAVPLYPHCASAWEGGTPLQVYDTLPIFAEPRAAAPGLWDSASPIKLLSRDDPPLLLVHGTEDKGTHLDQSTRFREAALAAGVPCELIVVAGAGHAFHLQPEQQDLRPAVLSFFARHLRPRPAGRP
jgi:acetyl esterase/lipase